MNASLYEKSVLLVVLIFMGVFFLKCAEANQEFGQALRASFTGQYSQAIKLWTKIIEKNPKSYVGHVNRGSAYIKSGHVLKGISDWHKAKELSPLFAYAFYTDDFIWQTSADNATLNYVVAVELDPDHIPSVVMTGSMYQELGQTDKAVELYRKSIDLTRNPLLKSVLDHWIATIESPSRP